MSALDLEILRETADRRHPGPFYPEPAGYSVAEVTAAVQGLHQRGLLVGRDRYLSATGPLWAAVRLTDRGRAILNASQ